MARRQRGAMVKNTRRTKRTSKKAKVRKVVGFPAVKPEAEGMSQGPLTLLRKATQKEVRELGCLSGAAHIVLRRGRCVFTCADGWVNPFSRVRSRFTPDTICMLHGCSKPLVAAAFLTLVDEGSVRLSDPVVKYMPFAKKSGVTRKGSDATLHNLLSMSAGVGYTDTAGYSDIVRRIKKGKIADLAKFVEELTKIPLETAPGTCYEYSYCTDLLGRLCEVVSGQSLDKFVHDRLLKPLRMKDTHFPQTMPSKKRCRLATLCDAEEAPAGKRQRATNGMPTKPYILKPYTHKDSAPGIMSGGGGIVTYKDAGMLSTARDYAQFCQMLLDDGVAPNGKRVLKQSSVRMLWQDSLVPLARGAQKRCPGWNDCGGRDGYKYWDYVSWSALGAHVTSNHRARDTQRPRTGLTMFMGGGAGAFWAIDRQRKTVVVSMTQTLHGREGGTDGSDGHGPRANDAAPFARAAADRSKVILPHEYGRYGVPCWPASRCPVTLPV